MNYVITGTGTTVSLGHRIAVRLNSNSRNQVVGATLGAVEDKEYPEIECDVTNVNSICSLSKYTKETFNGPVDVVVNCAGYNLILPFEEIGHSLEQAFLVNSAAIVDIGQMYLDQLKKSKGTICNIISNASHMPMTYSLPYNASKAAAHMITLQMARELTKRFGITVFGISPNRMAGTGMSDSVDHQVARMRNWSLERVHNEQLDRILLGEETNPECVAEFVAWLLDDKSRHKYLTGCVIPYGA